MLDLWTISLVVRLLAVIFGWRRASRVWLLWAVFYLASGVALRTLDILHWYGPHGWYVNVWIAQQVVSAGLLVFVVRDFVRPTALLVCCASAVAATVGLATSQAHHWPDSAVESVMALCGAVALALGIISTVGMRSIRAGILAVFLIGYALLSLAGDDYLTKPELGMAWSLLEILAFGAWAIVR